ncbi:hypothetical protein GCM10022223_61310 [Kineosporia mesophila]|uniref:PepSY domain-containing protein n=1 Tax=Kineosporia mesophila TaxID=566012 RepID=A0ABP7ALE8_9ACTN
MTAAAAQASEPISVTARIAVDDTPTPTPTPTETSTSTPTPTPTETPTATPSPTIITADQARAIALTAAGGGTITKFELKDEHSDKAEYRIELTNGKVRHKFRIDAFTGEITRHDIN